VRDLAESNFIGDRDEQNVALPSDPSTRFEISNSNEIVEDMENVKTIDMKFILGHPEREWSFRHVLSSASLLGRSCEGTLKLAGQSETLQKHGYAFGKHLALAWQASMDLEPFRMQDLPYNTSFSLVSAPVLFHLEHDHSLYEEIKKGRLSADKINYKIVHQAVLNGPGIERTKELQRKHGQAAMDVLNEFPAGNARTALQNIILAMQCL
jgi:decaprenyl-diphosphate synthase subunit 2